MNQLNQILRLNSCRKSPRGVATTMIDQHPELLDMRLPKGRWIGGYFAAAIEGVAFVFIATGAGWALREGHTGVALFLILIATFIGMLFTYVLHDATAVRKWRLTLKSNELTVCLPAHRSITHHAEPCYETIPAGQIAEIRSRLEAYSSFFVANMQRSYALTLCGGRVILLGEDRALGTSLGAGFSSVGERVQKLARELELEIHDYGMARGKLGLFSVAFASPPPWDAPDLDTHQQNILWQRAINTGILAGAGSLVFVLLGMLF